MTNRAISIRGTALLAALLTSCGKAPEDGKITLALNWFPEVEHGGYFAALVHGYYQEEGLDVEILPGGPDSPVIARVATGKATLGVDNADNILFGRAEAAPLVALMAPIQKSPRCILVHEESAIETFEELRNVTLAMSARGAFSHYLRKHAPLEGVEIVPYSGTVSQFLLDPNYAQQGYVFSEPFVAQQQGAKTRSLLLADLGFNPYTSVLFTNETFLREYPDVAERFVRASIKGWKKYLAEPEETNREINRLNPEMGLDILAFGVEVLRPLTEGAPMGNMTTERWQQLLGQLEEIEMIRPGTVQVLDAFKQ